MNQTGTETANPIQRPPASLHDVQIERARRSFAYFCCNFCQVLSGDQNAIPGVQQDAATGVQWLPFDLWQAQVGVADIFQRHRFIAVLKARQLGMTWLAVAYALWSMLFRPVATVLLFSLRDDEAVKVKQRLRGMFDHLPDWLRSRFRIEKDNDHELVLSNESSALAFPANAGDSYTGTLAIIDEADLIPNLSRLLGSVKPTIDGGGKLFLISRVDKFDTDSTFKRIYLGGRDGKTDWKAVFLPWDARPGRDAAWYAETKAEILQREHNDDAMAEHYPATDEEALAPPNYGGRFKVDWFRYYTTAEGNYWQFGDKKYHKDGIKGRFITVDAATSVKETAKHDPDWTVISTWGRTPCGLLVWLACLRLRVEAPDIYPHLAAQYARWNVGKAKVEGGGLQKSVPQTAQRQRLPSPDELKLWLAGQKVQFTGGMMNIIPYNPGGQDKLDRAQPMLNMAEAGRIWLPLNIDREFPLADVKSELLRFTGDPKKQIHDDIWDTLSMAAIEATNAATQRIDIRGQKFGCVRDSGWRYGSF